MNSHTVLCGYFYALSCYAATTYVSAHAIRQMRFLKSFHSNNLSAKNSTVEWCHLPRHLPKIPRRAGCSYCSLRTVLEEGEHCPLGQSVVSSNALTASSYDLIGGTGSTGGGAASHGGSHCWQRVLWPSPCVVQPPVGHVALECFPIGVGTTGAVSFD